MSQLIEGIDNEVAVAFILFTGAAAIAVPWYFFRPNSRSFHTAAQQTTARTSPSRTEPGEIPTAASATARSSRGGGEEPDAPVVSNRTSENTPTPWSHDNNDTSNYDSPTGLGSEAEGEHQTDDRYISVKVKHNTTDMVFSVPKTMTLINFKRHCYATEMEQGKNVRLIYNGRILGGEHYSLDYLGINNGCVIHAQISEHQTTQGATPTVDLHDLDIGFLVVPLMSLAMILCWICVISFDDLFGVASIIILSFLSFLFVLIAFIL